MSKRASAEAILKTFQIYITETYIVRFTGIITRWQRLCLWLAGIDVKEMKEGK